MSGSTSVPRPSITDKGFVAPAESDVLAGVQADVQAAFGGVLNFTTTDGAPTNATPQGQLSASESAIIGDANDTFLFLSNQIDPALASGRWQDGLARIYFITRNPALPTVVTATCTGLLNVQIPVGAQARATDGTLYLCVSGGTIPPGGSVDLQFAASITGPIACPAGSLTTIYQTIPGWDSITNAADGVLGVNVETRAAFEARRGQSVAKNSVGQVTSILGAVLGVPGVLDAYVVSNDTGTTATIGGLSIGANQLYVAATGGADQDVGNAIWTKKMPGGPYYASANTSVTVLDTLSGYSLPLPAYTVKFHRPTATAIKYVVTIANSTGVPSTALVQVRGAIIAAFAGSDGGQRARIGSTVYASRFYASVALLGAWAQVISIQVGLTTGNADTVALTIAQVPTTSAADISLVLV
jgi:uncharacterized phage protein gp47/JayE